MFCRFFFNASGLMKLVQLHSTQGIGDWHHKLELGHQGFISYMELIIKLSVHNEYYCTYIIGPGLWEMSTLLLQESHRISCDGKHCTRKHFTLCIVTHCKITRQLQLHDSNIWYVWRHCEYTRFTYTGTFAINRIDMTVNMMCSWSSQDVYKLWVEVEGDLFCCSVIRRNWSQS